MELLFPKNARLNQLYGASPPFRSRARKRLHSVLWEKAQTKLDMLNRAYRLDDLKMPPNNRLEKFERDLAGKHSISDLAPILGLT